MASTTSAPIVVTEKVAAEVLNISVGYLRRDRISAKTLPWVALGRAVRYNLEDVRAALAARTEGGPNAPR